MPPMANWSSETNWTIASVWFSPQPRNELTKFPTLSHRTGNSLSIYQKSLVSQLEEVNPRNMKHEEKLAFWINALLVYGISANNVKRISSVLEAAYSIGGHTISVDLIQNFILGCRLPRPGQWMQLWFPSKKKPKVRDGRKVYDIHHPEPLLLFALCSGSHSDPAVRLYTSKRVLEELESTKEEFTRSTITITKEQKIVLPKIVDYFANSIKDKLERHRISPS